MSSMPIPSPTPAHKTAPAVKADPYKADQYKAERAAAAKADSIQESKDTETSPESFLSYMLAGLMGSQNFAASSPVAEDREPISVPVSFGGTFNVNPSMLVLPEGVDAASVMINPEDGTILNPDLLAAMTPGIPTPPPQATAVVEVVVSGQTMTQPEGDPRLIATGLDPAQMQALVAKLAAMASDQAAAGPVPAQSTVATVSFLPDTSLPPPVLSAAPMTVPATAQPVVSAVPGEEVISFAAQQAATDEAGVPIAQDSEEFDPMEFRLAMKPSRYNVDVYQSASPSETTPPPKSPPVVGNPAHQMKPPITPGGHMTPPIAELPGDVLAGGTIKTYLDPLMPQIPPVSSTPLQSGTLVSNPVLQNVTAAQSHPTTQAVAALINRASQQGNGTQTLAVQLDPPELGKMQLKMRYEKGEPLRVHVVLEKADTMAMFQRDAHALENALNQAGLKTDSASLTFDMGTQSNFNQAMQDQTGGSGSNQPGWTPNSDMLAEEATNTQLSIVIDPKTGLAHYNMMV